LTPAALEAGYWRAYRTFYQWESILRGAWTHAGWGDRARHVAYAGGWKKMEPAWDLIIRARRASSMLPVLESVLSAFGHHAAASRSRGADPAHDGAGDPRGRTLSRAELQAATTASASSARESTWLGLRH
jgi:hypothetical protein